MENTLLFIFKHRHKSNSGFKSHTHTYNELIYFLKGSGTTRIGDTEYSYKSGDICCTESALPRSQKAEKRSEYICLGFKCDKALPVKSGVYSCEKDQSILSSILEMFSEFTEKKPMHKEICNHKLSEILFKISRIPKKESNEKSLQLLISELESDSTYNISVEELAKRTSYSYHYFRHEFKKLTGMSPVSYIMEKRIQKAKELLISEGYSCTLISQICGFSTPAQFSSIFKNKTGHTPGDYRKLHAKN